MKYIIMEVYTVPYAHNLHDRRYEDRFLVSYDDIQSIVDYINRKHASLLGKQDKAIIKAINEEEEYIPVAHPWGGHDVYSFSFIEQLCESTL